VSIALSKIGNYILRVDTRDTPEQAELRRAARRLAREMGPSAVSDLDDGTRAKRLAVAVGDAGWLELRSDAGDGAPLAGGIEAAIVAEALGAAAADVAFTGLTLADDLARRAGCHPTPGAVVAFTSSLTEPAVVREPETTSALVAVDGAGYDRAAYVLVPEVSGYRLAQLSFDGAPGDFDRGSDLTRFVRTIPRGARVHDVADQRRAVADDDLAGWAALGLALTSADLVGVMRGVLDLTVAYAQDRRQFGVPIGSFQAVQHLLADARCLMEGSLSVALHAAWAVDALEPREARQAGRVAKAYCSRAASAVCETAIQVHGGMGNTWDCLAHVYLRRSLLSSTWCGDSGTQLRELERERLAVGDGLS
jgi:alkylation response protein AidB-like acyl-CoA dehydrogenase